MVGQDPSASLKDKTEAFLNEFFTKGEVLVRELIEENERLRVAMAAAPPAAAGTTSASVPSLGVPVTVVEHLMHKVDRLEAECSEIRQIAGNVRRESGDFRTRMDALEREHYHLAAIHVAGNQFHVAASVDEVLRTITEILLNFVGVGRFTVYLLDEARETLFPVAREGGDPAERAELPLERGAGGEPGTARATAAWRAGGSLPSAAGALGDLPLVSGSRMVGLVRLESFLPQKSGFEGADRDLLELISEHAGVSLEAAWIRAHATDTPLRRGDIEQMVGA